MDINALKAELAGEHPITGPYVGDNAAAADQLNVVNIVRNRMSMTGREVAAEVVDAEYDALTDAKKNQIISLLSGDSVDPFGFAANVVKNVFEVGSATVANLAAARTETVSQAVAKSLGDVREGTVQQARAI